MAAEIRRSLDFFLATSSEGRVSRIYLSGGTAQIGALTQTMENRIGVEVEVLDPLRGLKVNGQQVDLDLINRIRPSLAVAVGLGLKALGRPMIQINLLPVQEAEKEEVRETGLYPRRVTLGFSRHFAFHDAGG